MIDLGARFDRRLLDLDEIADLRLLGDVGAGAFIGSNSALVAPVTIGDGAYVGSGSVVTKNVEPDALAVARGRQEARPGWAKAFRARHKKG